MAFYEPSAHTASTSAIVKRMMFWIKIATFIVWESFVVKSEIEFDELVGDGAWGQDA